MFIVFEQEQKYHVLILKKITGNQYTDIKLNFV